MHFVTLQGCSLTTITERERVSGCDGTLPVALGSAAELMACAHCEMDSSSAGESRHQTELGRGHVKAMWWSHITHIMSRGGKYV